MTNDSVASQWRAKTKGIERYYGPGEDILKHRIYFYKREGIQNIAGALLSYVQ